MKTFSNILKSITADQDMPTEVQVSRIATVKWACGKWYQNHERNVSKAGGVVLRPSLALLNNWAGLLNLAFSFAGMLFNRKLRQIFSH